MTSDRLAVSSPDVSHFFILPEPAHTVIVKACLGILLQSDGGVDSVKAKSSSLGVYAAKHWVDHAQFKKVSTYIEDGMRRLFDPAKPYFGAWLNLYNIDSQWYEFVDFFTGQHGSPLYYASFCGFRNMAAHLADKHPKDVSAKRGRCLSPLVAALHNRHFDIAELLFQRGADVDIISHYTNRTPLHAALVDGLVDIAEWLLSHGADAMSQLDGREIPLHLAAKNGKCQVVRMLLKHGVTVNTKNKDSRTSLHEASEAGQVKTVRLLLQHGADSEARDLSHSTPLHLASRVSDKLRKS